MKYQVPQFIGVESKIIGPLTLRQFIYISGGIGMVFILFKFLPFLFAALLSLPVIGFVGALSFYKVNSKPFINIVEFAVKFYTSSHLFLWRRDRKRAPVAATPATPVPTEMPASARLTRGKLHELAQTLDIKSDESINTSPQ